MDGLMEGETVIKLLHDVHREHLPTVDKEREDWSLDQNLRIRMSVYMAPNGLTTLITMK
jgi:hypothetical protein